MTNEEQAVQAITAWFLHVFQDDENYRGESGPVHARRSASDLYRSVVAPLLADRDARLDEALTFAGQMSEARRTADAVSDRLRAFANRLLRLDDPSDAGGVEDRRTITLDKIIRGARLALEHTDGYVTEVEASRRDWAAEALRLEHAYDEAVTSLSEEIAWQKHAYRDGTDKVATGRTIGMEDALWTLTEKFASRPVCAVHPEEGQ